VASGDREVSLLTISTIRLKGEIFIPWIELRGPASGKSRIAILAKSPAAIDQCPGFKVAWKESRKAQEITFGWTGAAPFRVLAFTAGLHFPLQIMTGAKEITFMITYLLKQVHADVAMVSLLKKRLGEALGGLLTVLSKRGVNGYKVKDDPEQLLPREEPTPFVAEAVSDPRRRVGNASIVSTSIASTPRKRHLSAEGQVNVAQPARRYVPRAPAPSASTANRPVAGPTEVATRPPLQPTSQLAIRPPPQPTIRVVPRPPTISAVGQEAVAQPARRYVSVAPRPTTEVATRPPPPQQTARPLAQHTAQPPAVRPGPPTQRPPGVDPSTLADNVQREREALKLRKELEDSIRRVEGERRALEDAIRSKDDERRALEQAVRRTHFRKSDPSPRCHNMAGSDGQTHRSPSR